MKKIQIKLFAYKSFSRGKIDAKKVNEYTSKMKRKELRDYIRFLKLIERKSKVFVEIPNANEIDKKYLQAIAKLYKGKEIQVRENPDLILGLRIIEDDIIYDYNLKNNLETIVDQI